MWSLAAGSLISSLSPQAWADASATDKCHAKVVAVATDQLSLDVTLLPQYSNPNDCKLGGVKIDTANTNTTPAGTTAAPPNACNPGSNAPCDNITHLLVTDNLVKDQLKQLHKGDRIQIVYYSETKKPTATNTPVEPKKASDTAAEKNPNDKASKEAQAKAAKANKDAKANDASANKDANANKDKGTADADKSKDADKEKSTDAGASADVKTQFVLKAWCVDFETPSALAIIVVLVVSAGACFLLTLLFSQGRPTQLIISEDNRYSNSRFQIALWFFVLITTYIAALWIRVWQLHDWSFIGGINIPNNLLLLSGMSAITFAGAKGITTSKMAAAGTATQPTPAAAKAKPKDGPDFFRDLTHNDGIPAQPAQDAVLGPPPGQGLAPAIIKPAVPAKDAVPPQFDFGDFQMVIVTLIAVATYLVLVFNFFGHVEYSKIVSLPDVDTTLLATFGLGQGAYLTKKAVGNVGTS
jgi:hypothetical protein